MVQWCMLSNSVSPSEHPPPRLHPLPSNSQKSFRRELVQRPELFGGRGHLGRDGRFRRELGFEEAA